MDSAGLGEASGLVSSRRGAGGIVGWGVLWGPGLCVGGGGGGRCGGRVHCVVCIGMCLLGFGVLVCYSGGGEVLYRVVVAVTDIKHDVCGGSLKHRAGGWACAGGGGGSVRGRELGRPGLWDGWGGVKGWGQLVFVGHGGSRRGTRGTGWVWV